MNEKWEKIKLGKTNLSVTPICWGCAPLGSMPDDFGYEVPEKQAIETLLKIFEGPVNFLDTASAYGKSEERIGKALKLRGGLPPDGFIIATKTETDSNIRNSVKRSCQLLEMNPLPLVYLHDPEHSSLSFEEIMASDGPVAELERMKKERIILNIGISGGPIDMLIEFVGTGRFDAVITHNRQNLLWQVADPLIEAANKIGIGIVNAAPYASGILAGGTRSAYQIPSKEILERVGKMENICQKYNVPLSAMALQFSLRDSRINSTAVGVSSPRQVDEILRLARLPIPDELWQELKPLAITEGDPEQ